MSSFDIGGVQKPRALKAVRDRAQQYLKTMAELGKPVESLSVAAGDYDAFMRAATLGRDKQLPGIETLVLGTVRIRRGAA